MITTLGISFLIMSTLLVLGITKLNNSNVYAEVNENTLESIANQTGVSEGIAQINTGKSPVYIDNYIGGFLYVINSGSDDVTAIDPNRILW